MSGLAYVGKAASSGPDLITRLQASALLASGPVNRTGVLSELHDTATGTYASKTYIDSQDGTFSLPSYYQTQDALNIPLTSVGQPGGIASLDATTKVPLAQLPNLGSGVLLGPFGPTSTPVSHNVGASPIGILDFSIGVQSVAFQPLVFATVLATPSDGGRPVIEARLSSGVAAYGSQTLVGRSTGVSQYYDVQPIAVLPCGASAGATPSSFSASTNIFIRLWMYDLFQSTSMEATGVISAVVYLLKVSL